VPGQRPRCDSLVALALRVFDRRLWRLRRYATVMAQPSDLEARVAALEARVGELAGEAQAAREDAAAARHLAAANDRDVAEVRSEIRDFRQATVASFNATRSDLTDLQTEMRTGFTEVRGQLDGAAAGLEQITGLLNTLIAQQGDQPGETS
jgi:chromosome segregation ATPase